MSVVLNSIKPVDRVFIRLVPERLVVIPVTPPTVANINDRSIVDLLCIGLRRPESIVSQSFVVVTQSAWALRLRVCCVADVTAELSWPVELSLSKACHFTCAPRVKMPCDLRAIDRIYLDKCLSL